MSIPCHQKIQWKLGYPCKGVIHAVCFGMVKDNGICEYQDYHVGGPRLAGVNYTESGDPKNTSDDSSSDTRSSDDSADSSDSDDESSSWDISI